MTHVQVMDGSGELELIHECMLLDALPVVDHIDINTTVDGRQRVLCTIWCKAEHAKKSDKQPQVVCNKSTCTTIEQAVRKLRLDITERHSSAGCINAAEAARMAAAAPSTRPPTDAMAVLMAARKVQLLAERAEAAAKTVNVRRDEARQALAALEREAAALDAAAVAADLQLPPA